MTFIGEVVQDGDCTRELEFKGNRAEFRFFNLSIRCHSTGISAGFPLGAGVAAAWWGQRFCWKSHGDAGHSQAVSELSYLAQVSQVRLYQCKEEHHWHRTAKTTFFPL